jgi:DNA-binding HxlR family transcriptional regulator
MIKAGFVGLSGFLYVDKFIGFWILFIGYLRIKSFKIMNNLQISNPRFLTYTDELLVIDILGGVDMHQIERMVVTLRISFKKFPPYRTTLDLYSDHQTEKLQRLLCDKWEVKLLEVSKTLYSLTLQLEEYRLKELNYLGKSKNSTFELSASQEKQALAFLKNKNLLSLLTQNLNATGILGEDDNAMILFLSLASHGFSSPFSVLCLAKSGMGKSYILQKLSECLPQDSFSFHSRISANALYYFDSNMINNKALIIEDLEWTTQMLSPLSTLQWQGKLINTRATKDKDGMLHSTTFQVNANLCLVACAYSDKNFEEISLPFLCLHLNHSWEQDILIMDYQKKCKAGLIEQTTIQKAQFLLKSAVACLKNVSIINPYALLIDLPSNISHPRKSLLLLLNFIEVITYFFQYQRPQRVNQETGEVFIQTQPEDIELAFRLLKPSLFRRADELSSNTRGFYTFLSSYLSQAKTNQFTALDIRKAKSIHPRTLNRYLNELKLYNYIQISGGNKHREGFIYKLTGLGSQNDIQNSIERDIQKTISKIRKAHENYTQPVSQNQMTDTPSQ